MSATTLPSGVHSAAAARVKPELSFWQIWNMCFGFLGIQFGFALQNANVSRIFQTLGASVDDIPSLWIAAPLTGLLVQPIIGYYSDRTWNRFGRRRPYFLAGALLASLALFAMPRSPSLWIAAGLLWVLDASINVAMEPFRAFVGDQLPSSQRAAGYTMQSFFIGIGAVVASMLPWLLARAGVDITAVDSAGTASVPAVVRYSFDLGAVVLLLAVLWTVLRTREYPPQELQSFEAPRAAQEPAAAPGRVSSLSTGVLWAVIGAVALVAVAYEGWDKQLYLLGAGATLWGAALLLQRFLGATGFFSEIMHDLQNMPYTMRRLVPVQFFSWLALFSMWIYTTSAVAETFFGSADPKSVAYNEGANWVGVLFAAYNGFAALAALVIPLMVRRLGMRVSHLVNLWIGGLALLSFLFIRDSDWLLLSMVGVGIAWASILSLPYALLSDSVPPAKMGIYMGIFNFFIVIPQLVAASALGFLLKHLLGGRPIMVLAFGGVSFLVAGLLALRVPQVAAGGANPATA